MVGVSHWPRFITHILEPVKDRVKPPAPSANTESRGLKIFVSPVRFRALPPIDLRDAKADRFFMPAATPDLGHSRHRNGAKPEFHPKQIPCSCRRLR